MAKDNHDAIKELMEIVTELADVVRDLDPGRTETYRRIELRFVKVRDHLARAKAFSS